MKHLAIIIPALALAACGSEPAPAPEPTETATPEPVSSLPAPDQERFSAIFASNCEGAEPVSTSVCRRAMGADEVSCEFGLGEDTALRHDATLAVNEDSTDWVLVDAKDICTEHGAHHVDP